MKKYILIGIFLLAAKSDGLSQNSKPPQIDSLKKILLSLKDTGRIDCLNQISYYYISDEKKDLATYYATLANTEAKEQNYIHGIAESFSNKAHVARHFDDDFLKSEKLAKESLRWYEKTGNKAGIDTAYFYLGEAWFGQGRLDESTALDKRLYLEARQKNDVQKMLAFSLWLLADYRQSGNYEQSFLLARERYKLALQTSDKIAISSTVHNIGRLYLLIGDYSNALSYFRKELQMDDGDIKKRRIQEEADFNIKMELAEAFSHLNLFDSAWYYYHLFKPASIKDVRMRIYRVSTGECYFLQKDYQQALQNFQLGLAEHIKLNNRFQEMRTLLDISQTYLALNSNVMALKYGREGLSMAIHSKAKRYIRDGYQFLFTVYDRWHQVDSAYFYYKKYIAMKDFVVSDFTKAKFVAYNYEQKIASLNDEKLIEQQQVKIQQQQLKQELLLKKILIGAIGGLFLLSIIVLRNVILKRKNEKHLREIVESKLLLQTLESEKKRIAFQQQSTELEMQALRAQMNPHFIFNCLSSINRFILKNESEAASDYLTKFSRLIRMVLIHSQQAFIALDDELEMLRLYLEMERLRFKYSFDYNINFKNAVNPENIFIPPLLLQPFAENAIWHGMMNKEGQGHLTISLSQENNELSCIIEDNGVGRAKAAELKSKSVEKKKSLGLQITKERLALLNKDSNETTFFEMKDLYDDEGNVNGTMVILKIRLHDRFEEHSTIT